MSVRTLVEADTVNVVSLVALREDQQDRIRGVDPRIRLTDASGWFDAEIRANWPGFAVRRYLEPSTADEIGRHERDAVLADADIVICSWPFPLDLGKRAPNLKWVHQNQAAPSNLRRGDLWATDAVVTSSRGTANPRPIAEHAIAGILHFARGLQWAEMDRKRREFDHRSYEPILLANKKICIVGTGGIGCAVAELAAALGMHPIGIRRNLNANSGDERLHVFAKIGGPAQFHEYLSEARVVVVSCQYTPDTTGLLNDAAFDAMAPDTILVNVARGEIIDEPALGRALQTGKIRGAMLDVYAGEFEHPPPEDLWSNPNILITPHVSGHSDQACHGGLDLFCENLRAFLAGQPMQNVVDWSRGY